MKLIGNRLTFVSDAATLSACNSGSEFKDGAKLATEYTYDANGNMTKDLNKGIDIQYNVLNLPDKVTFSDGSTISYLYGANGVKLRTIHKIGSTTTTMDYCGNVVYENGVAKRLLTEEGYVSLSDRKYHYYMKDHQGNNRVVVDQSGNTEEVNNYYPFGGIFESTSNVQTYKYNGKELDTEKGLNWYDYGARQYDAVLGRWNTVDPLAENNYSTSLYAYCKNNPINRIDIDGRDDYVVNKRGFVYPIGTKKYKDNRDRIYYFNGEGSPKQVSGDPIVIMDNKLMPSMFNSQKAIDNYSTYGKTDNIQDATNLFKFAADNSIVEWKIDVYKNENDEPTAIIITDHKENAVESGKNAKRRTKISGQKIIDIHSHPSSQSKGASSADMERVNSPTNAVYLKRNKTLHDYNSKNSNVTTIYINSAIDLQKYIQDKLK